MEKIYQPEQIESHWYNQWEKANYFKPSGTGRPYSIMIPPPNVTGSLHMGHAFQYVIMDTLIRFHRMQGDNTLWQVGTDHAGIATQMVVERQLAGEGLSRQTLGREKFEEKVWEWKTKSGSTITQQMRRMGISVDWERERFTLDPGLSKAVQEVFIRLYQKGLIYRGKRLVNWDPKLHTAISDLEVNAVEEQGSLWHLRYPLKNGSGYLIVVTTRPETMLGDTAVAVNPDDPRYQSLIGKTVLLPLANREIPIIADDYVDASFGTGCVKITPAHDFNDYAVGQRHQLPMINIFTPDAHLNENTPKEFQGLERFAARQKILDKLRELNSLEKTEAHTLKVPRGDRSGVVIEPYLTDQWFVKIAPLAKPAIDAVVNGDIQFVPKNWENTYFAWMRDIQDWCISRQLWWGHRIPAWYDKNGNVYVGESETAVREKYQLSSVSLTQDADVLDTWFSSALWTFSTLGWPEQTPELKTFHPTSLLVTGFDIIFFWVARMIMMSLECVGEIPFKTIYVHGLVRDAEGQKMSKSKGNVLDPIDLIDGISLEDLVKKRIQGLMQPEMAKRIEKTTREHYPDGIPAFGTDALRFTFCSLAATGRDIKFDLKRIEGYRNFCNKLWNAARYVLMQTENQDCGQQSDDLAFSLADRWIISELQITEQRVLDAVENYRFDHLAQTLYEFVWNEYCDWYLELSKPILWDESLPTNQHRATRYTLVRVLETILRLLHPIIPFITEEIWQRIAPLVNKTAQTIMLEAYPTPDLTKQDLAASDAIAWLKNTILAIRNIRGEMDIPPGKTLPVLLRSTDAIDRQQFAVTENYLRKLAKIESIQWLNANDTPPASATQVVGSLELFVPMAGLINKAEETARLNKNIQKLTQEIQRIENKLANAQFVANAPEAVVKKEQEKLAEQRDALNKLQEQIKKIAML